MSAYSERTTITCETETRKRLRSLKRGGESYDKLLNKMADQYDPEEAEQ